MADDYELQDVTTWRLRELLQHEKDNAELRRKLAAAEAEREALRTALTTTRQVVVVACGTTAPYIREALKVVDSALAACLTPSTPTAP